MLRLDHRYRMLLERRGRKAEDKIYQLQKQPGSEDEIGELQIRELIHYFRKLKLHKNQKDGIGPGSAVADDDEVHCVAYFHK